MDDMKETPLKSDATTEEIRKIKYNVTENAVETLLENVLVGKTVILPSDVFRSVGNSSINLSRDDSRKRKLLQNAESQNASDNNYTTALLDTNASNDAVFVIDAAVADNEEDGHSTRPVTPTGLFMSARPVSEQYIQAKRVLNSNPFGVEPPDFKNLPNALEEAFTLSAGYLAQLIVSSTSHLNDKLDEILKRVPVEASAALPNTVTNPIPITMKEMETNSQNLNQKMETKTQMIPCEITPTKETEPNSQNLNQIAETKAQQNDKNSPTKPLHNSTLENCPPPAPKPVIIDPFINFQLYLERIKMPPLEIAAHVNHVRILTNKEATKYMAKFGYTPKKKK